MRFLNAYTMESDEPGMAAIGKAASENKYLIFLPMLAVICIFMVSCAVRETATEPRLSFYERLQLAEERTDIEFLQERMPWLNIESARWRRAVLGDFPDGIPAPTDTLTIGLLTLESDYLQEIYERYHWVFTNRSIPSAFLIDEMEGYALQHSHEYEQSFRHYVTGRWPTILIDFEKEIVLFSFT
jgi:hypothetical protein